MNTQICRLAVLQRHQQAAWQPFETAFARFCAGMVYSAPQAHASRGFCNTSLPSTPAPSNAFVMPPEATSSQQEEVTHTSSMLRQRPAEWSVNVKSFLLGSQLDLVKLKPQFRDVLRAEGKVSRLLHVCMHQILRKHNCSPEKEFTLSSTRWTDGNLSLTRRPLASSVVRLRAGLSCGWIPTFQGQGAQARDDRRTFRICY